MPAGPLDFRATCGCFLPRRKRCQDFVKCIFLRTPCHGVLFGCLVAYTFWSLLLIRSGDVELNPGPPKPAPIFTRGSNRRESSVTDPSSVKSPAPEPTLKDVMEKLLSVDTRLAHMEQNFDQKLSNLSQTMATAYNEVKDKVSDLQDKYDDVCRENDLLRQELDSVKTKTDDLENRSRRNNLLFYGIQREDKESNTECETKVHNFLRDTLGIVAHNVMFDRVHRTGKKADSPIIARCVYFKDKQMIMKLKSKLKDTHFAVKEDFSDNVREIRKALYPFLKHAIDSGKRASIVYDHLLVEGKKYVLDESRSNVVEVKGRSVVPESGATADVSDEREESEGGGHDSSSK